MSIDYFDSPYLTIRGYSEEEVDKRIEENVAKGKMELVGKRKYFQEHAGTMWYAKLKRIE